MLHGDFGKLDAETAYRTPVIIISTKCSRSVCGWFSVCNKHAIVVCDFHTLQAGLICVQLNTTISMIVFWKTKEQWDGCRELEEIVQDHWNQELST
jgi:hypothetical protein